MKLINFSVTNFRSITAAHKIAISDRTVLVGKNNEGKSNLLKALQVSMELLQEHSLGNRLGLRKRYRDENVQSYYSYYWKRDFPINLQSRKSANQTILRLEFQLTNPEIDDFREKIGCNLNGSLPLEIRIGKENEADIKLKKPGKNTTTLSKKSGSIAEFVAERIYFNYIPAVRTDKEAIDVISRMLTQELRVLESEKSYINALKTIHDLEEPILEELSANLEIPLKEFLPGIRSVKIEMPESNRRTALRREFNVVVDDGTPTNIEYKGDGVKSLVALGLLKNRRIRSGASIVAIEEPESHLHPGAIHQLNEIIKSLSKDNQVLITTHNPLFVDRSDIRSNIIVNDGKATPAKSVQSIRDLLGIKASDNLTNASYALVVEGSEDVQALNALLPMLSKKVKKSIEENAIVIEAIGGSGNLPYKLSLLKTALCETHSLLDYDTAGRDAFSKAESDALITEKECTFVICKGMKDSEFEDCINIDIYKNAFFERFGVDLDKPTFKNNNKWSERVRATFLDQGKQWNDKAKSSAKRVVSDEVVKNPGNALNQHKRSSIDALVNALEQMIKS